MRYRIRGFLIDDRSFLIGTCSTSLTLAIEIASLLCSCFGFSHVQITDDQDYVLYDYQIYDDGIEHSTDFIHTDYVHTDEGSV